MQQPPLHRDEDLLRRILDTAHEAFIMIDAEGLSSSSTARPSERSVSPARRSWAANWRRRSYRTPTGALIAPVCVASPTLASDMSLDSASR